MTDQVNLDLIWASTGGVTDPGDAKYLQGWVSEIPTFQNFNFVLQNTSKNLLSLAENGENTWIPKINYIVGTRVIYNGVVYNCITSHTNQDPELDTTRSYWSYGSYLGDGTTAHADGLGMFTENINTRTLDLWDGNDHTVLNTNALIALNTTGSTDNWVIGNVKGELVCFNTELVVNPDDRNIDPILGNSYYIYHEGRPPIQSEVVGTIPSNPVDGKIYGRLDNNWVQVSSTTISEFPPQPVLGNGQGWYNLADGMLYLDIDDGDSSQWVPSSPGHSGGDIEGGLPHDVLANREFVNAHPIEAITLLREELDLLHQHDLLDNLDTIDQHPIAAITGLQDALDALALPDPLTGVTLEDYGETANVIGTAGATQDIDLSSGNVITMTISVATTLTFTTTHDYTSFTLYLENGGTNIIWPTGIFWGGKEEPVLTAVGFDLLTFQKVGTTWIGGALLDVGTAP